MIGRGKGDGEVPSGLFAFVWTRDKTDIQMSNAHNLDGLKYRWSGLADSLLASKWIQLLLALPCSWDSPAWHYFYNFKVHAAKLFFSVFKLQINSTDLSKPSNDAFTCATTNKHSKHLMCFIGMAKTSWLCQQPSSNKKHPKIIKRMCVIWKNFLRHFSNESAGAYPMKMLLGI